jgi:hypothetical protein
VTAEPEAPETHDAEEADWHRRVVGRSLKTATERSIDRGSRLIRAAAFSSSIPWWSQKRTVAMKGSWLYCSKNIHWSTRARSRRSSGRKGVPSARYHWMAFDSARQVPSGSSSSGMRPFGFFARNSGVREAPRVMSSSIRS